MERWAHNALDMPLSATPKPARSQSQSGRVRVAKAAKQGLIEPYRPGEAYADYLNRTDVVNGVKAELHRARDDLHNIYAAAREAGNGSDPRVRTVNLCMETIASLDKEGLKGFWREALAFAGRTGAAFEAVVDAISEPQPVIMGGNHQTSHGDERARIKALAAEHDDGLLRDIAAALPEGCVAGD